MHSIKVLEKKYFLSCHVKDEKELGQEEGKIFQSGGMTYAKTRKKRKRQIWTIKSQTNAIFFMCNPGKLIDGHSWFRVNFKTMVLRLLMVITVTRNYMFIHFLYFPNSSPQGASKQFG